MCYNGTMAKFELETCEDKKTWDNFVARHKEANFLQSWDFYEFHRSRGNEIVRRVVREDGRIVAAYAGVVENAKRGRHLAIAGGPIVNWTYRPLVEAVFEDIRFMGEKFNCVFVRVRPQLELSEKALKLFEQVLKTKKAPMYLSVEFAGILDLKKSEEELLAGMRQRLRRALRKAEKNGITVETSTDPADIETFYNIQLQTAKRHDFYAFSKDFLTKQFAAFAPYGEAVLYTAKWGGEILAQNFMIFYGNEASYHYGVSTELGTKLSGAPLLHLTAMRDARKKGIKRYNFWGIVDEDDTKHRFYGVSCFKRGFGVEELRYVPAHDLVIKPLAYKKTWLIETLRRRLRHV